MRTRPFRAAIAAIAVAVLFVPTPPPALRAQAAAGVDAALLGGSALALDRPGARRPFHCGRREQ